MTIAELEDGVCEFTEDCDEQSFIADACPVCRSVHTTPLGRLGRRLWVRCRSCGLDRELTREDY